MCDRGSVVSGIIPACAGSSSSTAASAAPTGDHPRVCGEQAMAPETIKPNPGSSPRVRGAGYVASGEFPDDGIIPACAGSS